jgi:hypothetical protein
MLPEMEGDISSIPPLGWCTSRDIIPVGGHCHFEDQKKHMISLQGFGLFYCFCKQINSLRTDGDFCHQGPETEIAPKN